jgi:hypothetical protein
MIQFYTQTVKLDTLPIYFIQQQIGIFARDTSTKLAKGAVLTHRPEFLRLTKLSTVSRATQTLLVRPAPPTIEARWFGFSSFPFQLRSQLGQNSQLLTTQRQQPVAAWVLRRRLAR